MPDSRPLKVFVRRENLIDLDDTVDVPEFNSATHHQPEDQTEDDL